MPKGEDWSQIEVEACVADYLRMLTLEFNGYPPRLSTATCYPTPQQVNLTV